MPGTLVVEMKSTGKNLGLAEIQALDYKCFIVREWQDRGVLHVHALVRIERTESSDPFALRDAARTAVATSKVDGSMVSWGKQVDCKAFRADGDGAKAIWYLSKALNYVVNDTAREGIGGTSLGGRHVADLDRAARRMRCSVECVPSQCGCRVHEQLGSRSHVVSASRRTRTRTGWSSTGLTRTVQRRLRKEWMDAQVPAAPAETALVEQRVLWAREWVAARAQRELEAKVASFP